MTEEEREFLEWMNQTETKAKTNATPMRNEDRAIDWDLERLCYDRSLGLK